MVRRVPISDPTAPPQTGGVRPTVSAQAGFTLPGTRGPVLEDAPDVTGFIQSVTRSLSVLFAKQFQKTQETEQAKKDEKKREFEANLQPLVDHLAELAAQDPDTLDKTEAERALQEFARRTDTPDFAAILDVLVDQGRQDAENAIGQIVPDLPAFAAPTNTEGAAQFEKRLAELRKAGINPLLANVPGYGTQYSITFDNRHDSFRADLAAEQRRQTLAAQARGNVDKLVKGTAGFKGSGTAARTPELAKEALETDLPVLLNEYIVKRGGTAKTALVDLIAFVSNDRSLSTDERLTYLDNFEKFATLPDGRKAAQAGGVVEILDAVRQARASVEDEDERKAQLGQQQLERSIAQIKLFAGAEAAQAIRAGATVSGALAAARRRIGGMRDPNRDDSDPQVQAEFNLFSNDADLLTPTIIDEAIQQGVQGAIRTQVQYDDTEQTFLIRQFNELYNTDADVAVKWAGEHLEAGTPAHTHALDTITGLTARSVIQGNEPANALTNDFEALLGRIPVEALSEDLADAITAAAGAYHDGLVGMGAEGVQFDATGRATHPDLSGHVAKFQAEHNRLRVEVAKYAREKNAQAVRLTILARTNPVQARVELADAGLDIDREAAVLKSISESEGRFATIRETNQQAAIQSLPFNLSGVDEFRDLPDDLRDARQNEVIAQVQDRLDAAADIYFNPPAGAPVSLTPTPEGWRQKRPALLRRIWAEVIAEEFNGATPFSDSAGEAKAAHERATSGVISSLRGDPNPVALTIRDRALLEAFDTNLPQKVNANHQAVANALAEAATAGIDVRTVGSQVGKLALEAQNQNDLDGALALGKYIPGVIDPELGSFRFTLDLGARASALDSLANLPGIGRISQGDAEELRAAIESTTAPKTKPGVHPRSVTVQLDNGMTAVVTGTPVGPGFFGLGPGGGGVTLNLSGPLPEGFSAGAQVALDGRTDPTDRPALRTILGIPLDNAQAAEFLDVAPRDVPTAVQQIATRAIRFGEILAGE